MTPSFLFFVLTAVFCVLTAASPTSKLNKVLRSDGRLKAIINERSKSERQAGCVCGAGNRKRIVGGTEAVMNSYPWMVGVFWSSGELFCGGAIINDRYILSASHCFKGVEASSIYTVLGDYDRSITNEVQSEKMPISSIIMHEGYGDTVPAKVNNDIALLRSQRQISFRDNIQPICLPPPTTNSQGETGIVAGWGTTTFGGVESQVLLEVDVPILPDSICQANFTRNYIPETMMCAGYLQGGKDACQGDSGGPLFLVDEENVYDVVGVISYGRGCATPGYAGVYTDVVAFLPWIESKTSDAMQCSRPTTSPPIDRTCGIANTPTRRKRIVGGTATAPNQYPWTAILTVRRQFNTYDLRCGATLISDQWVITTAKCINGFRLDSLAVILGDHDVTRYEQKEIQRLVSFAAIHPDFDATKGITNDIALLKLNSPVTFNKYISPVCLPPVSWGSLAFDDIEGVATGFGWTDDRGTSATIQQEAFLNIITSSACSKVYGSAAAQSFVLCASGAATNENICQYDYGGQLSITSNDGSYQLVGVGSFIHSRGCSFSAPAGFMRVTQYLKWINSVTKIPLSP